jgi:Uma2 family endonuclease
MSTADIIAPTHAGPESNGMHMTPEEFDVLDDWDENYRYELVNGVLIVVPPAAAGERSPNDELGYLLRSYRDKEAGTSIIDETMFEQTIVCGGNRRRADRAIWTGLGRAPDPLHDTPTVVIEFVSQSRRDRRRDYEIKRREYLDAGVQEYWIIDRYARRMTVIHPENDKIVISEQDVYSTDLLPGFELPLGRLLSKADPYRDE